MNLVASSWGALNGMQRFTLTSNPYLENTIPETNIAPEDGGFQ